MGTYETLGARLEYSETEVIRPLRTTRGKPGQAEIDALVTRPKYEIQMLLDEKDSDLGDPGGNHLIALSSAMGVGFSLMTAVLVAFAGFVAGDSRLQTRISAFDAGQTYVSATYLVLSMAMALILFTAVAAIRGVWSRYRARQWIVACRYALRLINKREEAHLEAERQRCGVARLWPWRRVSN